MRSIGLTAIAFTDAASPSSIQAICSVLASCERDDMTIDDMLDGFDIERIGHYFERSLNHWQNNREQ